ncbi:MAG: hypothetical protein AAFR35_01960 [Pseudomonadota bacterium]
MSTELTTQSSFLREDNMLAPDGGPLPPSWVLGFADGDDAQQIEDWIVVEDAREDLMSS